MQRTDPAASPEIIVAVLVKQTEEKQHTKQWTKTGICNYTYRNILNLNATAL